MLNIRDVTV
jgi:hypothetical protein